MNKDEIMENLCWLIESDMKRMNLKKQENKLKYYFIINNIQYNINITIEKEGEQYGI